MEYDANTGELTGHTLGQYQLGRLLGQGGMAEVYEAQQSSIGRTVAIKVMPSNTTREPDFLERFEREVKTIAELQHPRVLPVYDYGHGENRPYIVMAYLSGGTLEQRIKQGPMFLEDVVRLVQQMAEALDYAHGKGIIHRDFKPANVLLDEQGNAHLADFGIARLIESTSNLTGSGVVGTPSYIAPEVLSGGNVTRSVDVYALGITLYEMLTGQQPFPADTPMRIISAHLYEPPPDVRLVRPELPEGVSYVILRAMAKNPVHRFVSAGALAQALSDAAAGKPITKPKASELYKPGTMRLNPPAAQPAWRWIGGAGAITAIGLAILFATNAFGSNNSAAQTQPTPTEEVAEEEISESTEPTEAGPALPFPVAGDDEVLVIVTDFSQSQIVADTRIYQALAAQVSEEGLTGVRVERLEGERPLLQDDAIAIGEQYGATLVIWGTADDAGIEPKYEIVRNREAIESSIELAVAAGSDPSTYSLHITEGLSSEFEYLMLYLLGQIALANDQPEEAVQLLGRAGNIALGERGKELGQANAMLLSCKTNRELDELDDAVEDCSEALAIDPEFTPALYLRGLINAQAGNNEAAMADLNEALDVSSMSSGMNLTSIGSRLLENREPNAAKMYFDHAVEVAPEDYWAYCSRATYYEATLEWENQIADLTQCMALTNRGMDHINAYAKRAMAYFWLGDSEAALADINAAVAILPDSNYALAARAFTFATMEHDLDQALEDINRAIEISEAYPMSLAGFYDTRAYVHYRRGEYDEALADLEEASKSADPKVKASALYHRGLIYEAQGKIDEAIAEYQAFLELKPDLMLSQQILDATQRLEALGGEVPK